MIKKISICLLVLVIFHTSFDASGLIVWTRDLLSSSQNNIVDRIYWAKKNPNVVDNFKIGAKPAQAALDPSELEYMIDIGPINGSTSANYVYASFFNPSGSGRTAVVKRVAIRINANGTGNYVNFALRRTTAASGGTLINANDVPKKNNNSSNSVMDVRTTGVTVTFSGVTQSRLLGQPNAGAIGQFHSVRDITFGSEDEKIILQPGEGMALYQEAAGTANNLIRIYFEWEEVTSTPSAQNEYLLAIQRVENAAGANYVYNSFFNPVASGKTAIVKRVWFGSETCDTTATYLNRIILKRISAASGGTQITGANIPKKHTGSADSAMDVRYAGVTVTQVGGNDAWLGHITPCGAAGQPHGWMMLNFQANDEKLILQPGEGIALISDATGDVDQLNRMIVEWKEVDSSSTPSSQGEYIWASNRVEVAAALGTTFYTFFNPSGSGKTAVIKRLVMRVNSDTTATYSAWNFQRISAASGGTLVTASDVPKKHTSSTNSVIEIRWCGASCGSAITATYSGSRSTGSGGISDSGILKANGPGVVGQIIGHREIVFGGNEQFVLQEGEGLGFYLNYLAGDVDHYVKILVEWKEVASAPSAQNGYIIDIGPMPGSTSATYNYASFFNPAASGKTAIIERISLRIDTISTAVYIPMRLRYISAASGGTQITGANIPKKHTGSADSAMDIRRSGVTNTYTQSSDAQLIGVETPGAVGSATAPSVSGYQELIFTNDEPIVLQPGQGVALGQLNAGDADFRVKILFEWREVDSSNTPSSQGEYLMTTGPVNASLNSGYVYSSFFNPTDSGKNYVVKRIGIRVNRNVTSSTALAYIPATLRKISSASNGTTISTVDVPQKHASTTVTTADIRHTDVTVNFDNSATSSRLLGVTVPGAINQNIGIYESEIIFGDELILAPGEGIALYQETSAIDTAFRFRFMFEWSESDIDYKFVQSGYRIFQNIDSTSVGPPLAAQNTTTTVLYGNQFRLRLLIHVSSSTLVINGQDFKLQFVDMGSGTCASPSGGNPSSYIDVTSTTAIAYYNNPTPSDGAVLTATTTDPTHGGDAIVNQTYEEVNNFTNSQAAISFGEDGLWDFSLRDYAASTSTTYCLRVVEADNTLFYNYEFYPAINFINVAPTINSVTDVPDPVNVGSQITFTVDWEDQNSDNTRTFVCKSDAFTTSTLTCPGGWWTSSTAFAATDPIAVNYTAQAGDVGTNNYYIFVCDTNNACSNSTSSTFTVNAANSAPTINSVTDAPDPVNVGSQITFTVDWSDVDSGDLTRTFICKTNSFTSSTLTCDGGWWSSSTAFATTDPVDVIYTTQTGDIGTNNYYAFTCDNDNACSSGSPGTFTVNTGNSAPTINSATDDPDPVTVGSPVTFTVNWSDADAGDLTRSFICKTNSFTSSTLTCPGGAWASSTSFSSINITQVSYTAVVGDLGTNNYYAFVCDDSNACSNGSAGTFTVVKGPPIINSVIDAPDPVVASNNITFTVNWTDPEGDNTRSFICKTNAITTSTLTCPGGWYASSTSMAATNPVQMTYTAQAGDAGPRSYYAFVCDSDNKCSTATVGSFLVNLTNSVSGYIEGIFNILGDVLFR